MNGNGNAKRKLPLTAKHESAKTSALFATTAENGSVVCVMFRFRPTVNTKVVLFENKT